MMSPRSIAQFLTADMPLFDLIVFDEASQIEVPEAVGAISWGRRCIVVGDPKQMPPTRFFASAEVEEDEDADEPTGNVPDLESILDEVIAARVPVRRLTGHYRSKHESLIEFSNRTYYDGDLITYPSVHAAHRAVRLTHLPDGRFDGGEGRSRTNEVEAKAVVAEVIRRLSDPKTREQSIGVVTCNAPQRDLIEDLLDAELDNNPGLSSSFDQDEAAPETGATDAPQTREKVFVKNLETVQGDERDVILMSVGYGPRVSNGAFLMSFGPLNKVGGQRRLNVAITRARQEVIVYASFRPEELKTTAASPAGVRDLQEFLRFADGQQAQLSLGLPSPGHRANDDFETALAKALEGRGWQVTRNVGASKYPIDLAVVDPNFEDGRFLAGIECDGSVYQSIPTVRDRERIRPSVFERLGWRMIRVWSKEFFLDDTALEGLDKQLTQLKEASLARQN